MSQPVYLTCGPAVAPMDQVRRLTNVSTGSLGVFLAGRFRQAGLNPILFKSDTAVAPDPEGVEVVRFDTNENLAALLQARAEEGESPRAVFHAAALTDFQVAGCQTDDGVALAAGKIPSRVGSLTLRLVPSPKVLPRMIQWFPKATVIGWKYEVEGDRDSVAERGRSQLTESHSHACVLNGPAWGDGFGWLTSDQLTPLPDRQALADQLCQSVAGD